MEILQGLPEGPVWDAAAAQENWLLRCLTNKGNGKLGKEPMCDGVYPVDRDVAAKLTFEEAKNLAAANSMVTGTKEGEVGYVGIGHFARTESVIFGCDIDNCISPDGTLRKDVRELVAMGETVFTVSPSGTGVRAWVASDPDGDFPQGERNGFGAAGINGKFMTFTDQIIALPGSTRKIGPAPRLLGAIRAHLPKRGTAEDPGQYQGSVEPIDEEEAERKLGQLIANNATFASAWNDNTASNGEPFPADSRSERDLATIGTMSRAQISLSEVAYLVTECNPLPSAAAEDWRNGDERQMRRAYQKGYLTTAESEFEHVSEAPANPHLDPKIVEAGARARLSALFKPWKEIDLTSIPRVRFLYGDFYARGYTSVTAAPPKVGKSMLCLAEAIDMVTGRGFLTGKPREPLRVVYFNLEDDQDMLNARVSALITHYNIAQSEIEGRLYPTSGVSTGFHLLGGTAEPKINGTAFDGLSDFVRDQKPDVIIFDPLQDLSRSPETNEVFRMLAGRLRQFSSTHDIAVGLVHHTRKTQKGQDMTMDDMRGGSALRGAARFNRILAPMVEKEGGKLGVEDWRYYFRIAESESNLAPPTSNRNHWFKRVSVCTPAGYSVGAVEPWSAPDMGSEDTPSNAAMVRAAILRRDAPPRKDIRAADWIGKLIAETLGLDITQEHHKAKAKHLQKVWEAAGYLTDQFDKDKKGKEFYRTTLGPNDPLEDENAVI